jgi:GNAT superfamily N-acetyltransferase
MKALEFLTATSDAHIRLAAPLFDQYRVFYGQTPDLEASYRFLRERWIARESVLFLALDDGGEAIGFVQLFPVFLSGQMRRFWLLNDLYVKPSGRRQGTARGLMQRAGARSRNRVRRPHAQHGHRQCECPGALRIGRLRARFSVFPLQPVFRR